MLTSEDSWQGHCLTDLCEAGSYVLVNVLWSLQKASCMAIYNKHTSNQLIRTSRVEGPTNHKCCQDRCIGQQVCRWSALNFYVARELWKAMKWWWLFYCKLFVCFLFCPVLCVSAYITNQFTGQSDFTMTENMSQNCVLIVYTVVILPLGTISIHLYEAVRTDALGLHPSFSKGKGQGNAVHGIDLVNQKQENTIIIMQKRGRDVVMWWWRGEVFWCLKSASKIYLMRMSDLQYSGVPQIHETETGLICNTATCIYRADAILYCNMHIQGWCYTATCIYRADAILQHAYTGLMLYCNMHIQGWCYTATCIYRADAALQHAYTGLMQHYIQNCALCSCARPTRFLKSW